MQPWLHTTRNAESHAFAAEVTALIGSLPNAQQHVFYTGEDAAESFIAHGRLNADSIAGLHLPADATVYLCGPSSFMDAMHEALITAGIDPTHIRTELFGALPPINPGIVASAQSARPHPPACPPGTGPQISFSRSGFSVNWSPDYHTILELAEACDIPTRYSCRSGVRHTCVTPVIEGSTTYSQRPLEEPPAGAVLICVATPHSDVVLDL
jgi:ferredoxin-NADP reductase